MMRIRSAAQMILFVLQMMRIRSAAQMILNVCFADDEDKVGSTDDTEYLFYR